MDWFIKAANNGNTKPMYKIGLLYHHGDGVTKNIPSAIKWHTKAANQGNVTAQYILGLVYKNYAEVKDLQKAANWYQKAADKNYWLAEKEVKELNKQGYYAKDVQEGILIAFTYFMVLIFKNIPHLIRRISWG
jgi:TPR repeat protein